jgi:uncharacterized protein YacL
MRGQALVEFALILPIMMLILLGSMGLGLTILHREQMQHAANEIAIAAASETCVPAMTKLDKILGYTPDESSCIVTGQIVEVRVSSSWPALLPMLPETIGVSARAVVR